MNMNKYYDTVNLYEQTGHLFVILKDLLEDDTGTVFEEFGGNTIELRQLNNDILLDPNNSLNIVDTASNLIVSDGKDYILISEPGTDGVLPFYIIRWDKATDIFIEFVNSILEDIPEDSTYVSPYLNFAKNF